MCSAPEAPEPVKPVRPLPPPADLLIGADTETPENAKKKATGKRQFRTNGATGGNSSGLGIPL